MLNVYSVASYWGKFTITISYVPISKQNLFDVGEMEEKPAIK